MSKPIRELNLELGRPDAAEALRRLAAEVEAARHLGTPAMKLIHGYGSSGRGGGCAPPAAPGCGSRSCAFCLGRNSLYSMRRHGDGWPRVPACGRTGTWTRKTGALPLCC